MRAVPKHSIYRYRFIVKYEGPTLKIENFKILAIFENFLKNLNDNDNDKYCAWAPLSCPSSLLI